MMNLRRTALLAGFSLAAVSLFAHETWLAPNQGYVAPGLSVRIDMSSGGAFPIMETPIEPARLARFGVRLGEDTLKPTLVSGPKSLKLNLTLPKEKEGLATAFVSLKPRRLTLTPDKVVEYLEEINQPALLERWKGGKEPRTWREEYAKHAKAFFRVGKTEEGAWLKPAGLALEIIPLSDPTRGNPNEDFKVQVLKDGQPLSGLTLTALVDAKRPRSFVVTDTAGQASLKLNRPGRWLIEGTDLRETTKAGLDFESDFTTLLVTVIPAR
ncbi:MAG: DUF4198 domain-containing protein [Vicinamibacteria bacterium]|nr:DUF4198 domain-containing protein [Vicinamibacteria bacterium]